MTAMNGTHIEKPRARKEACRVLAVAMQTRYRKLLEASGENEIVVATADLAQCMYENVEFTIWALKTLGGMNPPPPEQLRPVSKTAPTPMLARPEVPPVRVVPIKPLDLPCTCPPLEHGIIGRERHMTSCPKFKP